MLPNSSSVASERSEGDCWPKQSSLALRSNPKIATVTVRKNVQQECFIVGISRDGQAWIDLGIRRGRSSNEESTVNFEDASLGCPRPARWNLMSVTLTTRR